MFDKLMKVSLYSGKLQFVCLRIFITTFNPFSISSSVRPADTQNLIGKALIRHAGNSKATIATPFLNQILE